MNQASKRLFSASLYNYGCSSNPRVFLTLSRDGAKLGDLVFEVFQNQVPRTAENFLSFIRGCQVGTYKGTTFTGGYPGIAIQGGRVTPCNVSADGGRLADENLSLRHTKRGVLSLANDGENANGSEFIITLSDTSNVLDGYHSVVGELVEGQDVLDKAELSLNRLGQLEHQIKIEDCGTR